MFAPLLLLALALSVNSAAVTKECQLSAGDIQCLVKLQKAGEQLDELDVDNTEDLKPFQESCKAMMPCINVLKCAGEDSKESIDLITGLCKFIDFIIGPFSACGEKLEKANSKCYEDWDPIINDDENKKPTQAEVCKSFVGEKECVKKGIIATCGQKEWDVMKANLVNLNKDVTKCNL
ncbi:unnamed protein product [Caenorhabditis angaria]|uniref:T20D4.11-like domain-containing protein n=1 Tax=Caenorhabditis angaria TaxID=860376 RepID=A0A9P1IUB7_9PELO|nr:unnamed protein product [Caenorhabditis angaria]